MTELILTHDTINEVDDFLEHFGVPGMKWGRRKASYNEGGSTGKERHASGAQAYLDKNGGSKGKAIAKIAGKHLVQGTILNAAQQVTMAALKNHPSARAGATAVGSIIGIGLTVSNARDAYAVGKAKGKRQGRVGPQ